MRDLTELLSRPVGDGYPTDYLLARVRGRRAVSDAIGWFPGEETDGPVSDRSSSRRSMAAELRWVYHQMNGGLRNLFAPLFIWFEVRTVILCHRFRCSGNRQRIAGCLAGSLLTEPLKRLLAGDGEPAELLDAVAEQLTPIDGRLRTLGDVYRKEGGREFEQRLDTVYLERMTSAAIHPVLRVFFREVIDLRNLVTLAKKLRWQVGGASGFIRGGSIDPERYAVALSGGTAAEALLHLLAGPEAPVADLASLERYLIGRFARRMRKLAREPQGIGLVTDYLWRCSLVPRNPGLLSAGERGDDALLREVRA